MLHMLLNKIIKKNIYSYLFIIPTLILLQIK